MITVRVRTNKGRQRRLRIHERTRWGWVVSLEDLGALLVRMNHRESVRLPRLLISIHMARGSIPVQVQSAIWTKHSLYDVVMQERP